MFENKKMFWVFAIALLSKLTIGNGFTLRMKLVSFEDEMESLQFRFPMEMETVDVTSNSCAAVVEQLRLLSPFDLYFNQLHVVQPSNDLLCIPYIQNQDQYEQCMALVELKDQVNLLIQQGLTNDDICRLVTLKKTPNEMIPDRCTTCRYVTHFISECVSVGNQTLDVIEAAARIACAAEVGQRVSPSCDIIIKHFNDLIHWIGEGLTPTDCCKKLDLCAELEQSKEVVVSEIAADPCVFCTEATAMIEDAVKKDNSTIEAVREGLKLLCNRISEESKCNQYLEHFDEVAQWLQDGKEPREICKNMGLCPVEGSTEMPKELSKPNDPQCTACNALGVTIEILSVFQNETIGQIRDEFDTVCSAIPPELNINCTDWLSKFDDLVSLIQNGQSPTDACNKIGLCSDSTQFVMHLLAIVSQFHENGKHSNDMECSGCKVLGTVIKTNMKNATIITQLRDEVETTCKSIPVETHMDCSHSLLVLDEMVALIIDGTSLNDVCDRVCKHNQVSLVKHEYSEQISDPGCTACNVLGTAIEVLSSFQNDSIAQIRSELDTVCSAIPPELSVNCTNWLSKFDELVQLIQSGQSPEDACIKIGLCSSLQHTDVPAIRVQDGLACVLCSTTATAIETTTKYDASRLPLIKQGLGVACTFLPGDSQCDELLSKFDELAKLIENGEDPKEVCTVKFHMCSALMPKRFRKHFTAIE